MADIDRVERVHHGPVHEHHIEAAPGDLRQGHAQDAVRHPRREPGEQRVRAAGPEADHQPRAGLPLFHHLGHKLDRILKVRRDVDDCVPRSAAVKSASIAAIWPKFRVKEIALTRGSRAFSPRISCQDPSFDPSSTKTSSYSCWGRSCSNVAAIRSCVSASEPSFW